jgi:hypothetical protein
VRALKVLVVAMGVLIVVGTVTLVALLVQRIGGGGSGDAPFRAALGLPEGSRITGIASTERGLAVLVSRPDGDRVLLLDPRGGRVIGEVTAR